MLVQRMIGLRKRVCATMAPFSIAVVFVVANGVLVNPAPAVAGSLEDRKAEIDRQAEEAEHSLEFLDAGIAESAAKLARYQAQLPQVQEAVNFANANVAAAAAAADALRQQLREARASKTEIAQKIEADEVNLARERRQAGRIAAQAYKNMGVELAPRGLVATIPDRQQLQMLSILDRTSSRQLRAISALNGLIAAKENSQDRLKAVEAQIKELKEQSEAALKVQERVKAEAVAKQNDLNALTVKTKKLNKSLLAQKPAIEQKAAKLRTQQREIADKIAQEQRKARQAWLAEQAAAGNSDPVITPVTSGLLGFVYPVRAPITSGFGWRPTPPGTIDFWGTGGYTHTGVDFGAACGTAMRAPAAGVVATAGWLNNGGGNTVKIDHGIIGGNAVSTVFYHNTSVAVSNGARVNQGQTISYVGSTGNSTGCHAHFEIWINGQPVDPLTMM